MAAAANEAQLAELQQQLTGSISSNNQRLLDAQAVQHKAMNDKMDRLLAVLTSKLKQ